MAVCYIKTPLGPARIEGDNDGVSSVTVLDSCDTFSETIPLELQDATTQLEDYFDKRLTTFNLKLNPKGTIFQKRVWDSLKTIPYGKTTSYTELSKILGDRKAVRAVANANAKNPLWIIVPCHRVIGSDGSLTGYAGGLQRKKWLLHHEGAIRQQTLFK